MTDFDDRIELLVQQGIQSVTAALPIDLLVEMARRHIETRQRTIQKTAVVARRTARPVTELATASVRQKMKELAAAVAQEVRVEWSSDLLRSRFQMPDGSAVTWGQASIAQHEATAKHLESKATGDLKAAAAHHKAVQLIREGHVMTLESATAKTGGQRAVS